MSGEHYSKIEVAQIETKVVEFANLSFKVSGISSDRYFQEVQHNIVGNSFLFKILQDFVPPNATIVDVGANIGVTAMLAAKAVRGAKIIAIEPSPISFACLCQTIAENNCSGIKPIQLCISDRAGSVAFEEESRFLALSHVILPEEKSSTGGQLLIPAKSLDELIMELELKAVDLVKIDVEGFEPDVLAGMDRIISTMKPLILMEFNSFSLTQHRNYSPRALLDTIRTRFGICFVLTEHGALKAVSSPEEFAFLLHANMTQHGCVDDLVFTSDNIKREKLSGKTLTP